MAITLKAERMRVQAKSLETIERNARQLLAQLGKFTENVDTARLGRALGSVSSAVEDLEWQRRKLNDEIKREMGA